MVDARGALPLTAFDLALAAMLVVGAGAVSLVLRLDLERRLAVAALRTVVQLLLVGYVLRFVFALDSPLYLALVMAVMIWQAGRAAVARSDRRYPGVQLNAFTTLALTGIVTTFTVTAVIVEVRPWYRAQYVVPLLGMILGNALTGVSLCLDRLLESLDRGRAEVEMELALGATRWEAARDHLRKAVRQGMIPMINSMMVVGLVSLPGMMTGQILEGADPLAAVKYQIVVMFMLAAASAAGSMLVALLAFRRLFNGRHQLAVQLIVARGR